MTDSQQQLLAINISASYGKRLPVLHDFTLEIRRGEILGLVGQSGSGKSTLALSVLGLLGREARVKGSINFDGRELLGMKEREMRALRGRSLGLVLQSPLTSLNPALKIRTQLREAWRAHANGSGEACDQAIREALTSVSLPSDDEFLARRPSQLSVGQAQRVLIAMAIIHRPLLILADEATSALDAITQSEILALFTQLNREMGTAILYISHDLPAVAEICQRVAILHEGTIVEQGTPEQIFRTPNHPYTRRLVSAMPRTLGSPVPESARAASVGN